jgi:tRNA (Thr-GGU) A37 N-methylase
MPVMASDPPLPVIGVVRSDYSQTEHTPVQSSLNRAAQATVEIAEAYRDGLDGLAGFDYAWLLTWLHRPHRSHLPHGPNRPHGPNQPHRDEDPPALRQVPFLLRPQQRLVGIFATRGPRRVNPIGLSLIRLTEVTDRAVKFAGVDMLDGTPVLDIKPYVTRFDRPPGEPRCGWFDEITMTDGTTPAGPTSPTS